MTEENTSYHHTHGTNNGMCGGIYGIAFIGALVYFLQHATSFWIGVFGFFKAVFWPAVLMYKLLEYLKL